MQKYLEALTPFESAWKAVKARHFFTDAMVFEVL
jgi:hypothetical protein